MRSTVMPAAASDRLPGHEIAFRTDLDPLEWDEALIRLGGHPLQSSHWGQARERVDGRKYLAIAAYDRGAPIWMARADIRALPLFGKLAWVPRGPTVASEVADGVLAKGLRALSDRGFTFCASSPWRILPAESGQRNGPRTIWIDLSRGRDQLWAGLQKKWRHGVGYAARSGVQVSTTRDPERVREFYRLCQSVSQVKGFSLPASESLMWTLLGAPEDGPVSSHLFAAIGEGRLAAGAFIIKCGGHIHYFWGATDRELAKLRPGEALHWAVIEWAISQGCTLYDLEGIDPVGNAGTYEFKKKMGGDEVTLPAVTTTPLSLRGRLIAPLIRRFVNHA